MIQHFQFQPMYKEQRLPGWTISFYFKQNRYEGNYLPDGKIEWTSAAPPEDSVQALSSQIHDLMLYHVYDKQ
ncbi:YheE family protein [Falsibacillus pallidus]|uniref:YheE family protein n=1 Tax=Falsibacillus pallidus TaxID=493781 RepID=A0A370H1H2_9BACI|nr:YheE family protein [Falsibacillus pallidus]RDI47893.1 hypothetical protein DFR59_101558 [Falsibacillus pallidus]